MARAEAGVIAAVGFLSAQHESYRLKSWLAGERRIRELLFTLATRVANFNAILVKSQNEQER